jgi:predicted SAM-dependent methyltransferase
VTPLAIDIGCGAVKRAGCVGVDKEAGPGVDHVVDVEREPLPFADRSVATIFSAHCLEHLAEHALVFHEISRVAVNGAALEIWTPYTWTNEAFIYTHRTFFNELHYLHPCYMFPEHWQAILGARWQLTEVQFVVTDEVLEDLRRNGVSLDFALKYLKGVVVEFGVRIRIWHENAPEAAPPARTWSFTRDGERFPVVDARQDPPPERAGWVRRVMTRVRRGAPGR